MISALISGVAPEGWRQRGGARVVVPEWWRQRGSEGAEGAVAHCRGS